MEAVVSPTVNRNNYTKEELTPYCVELFRNVQAALPLVLAERLTSNKWVITHGGNRTLFLFDVWDKNQTDVLPRQHFKYCLGYNHLLPRAGKTDGYFHLWMNTIRLYRKREEIISVLEREIPLRVPRGFRFVKLDRALNVVMNFDFPDDLATLPAMLTPRYVDLISAMHPVLMPIIDQFREAMRTGERRAEVARRGRIAMRTPRTLLPELVREYTRSIPRPWRAAILVKYDGKCAICRTEFGVATPHMDHIVPFSKGGKTEQSNLQPLCGPCNLRKGNRLN